jgi:HAE1 family hydrophobic/amphiphilic exporter-1
VCLIAGAVILANIPLYRLVNQDYVPTNVDESEFEVSINAQEGATLAAMDATLSAVEAELRAVPGVQRILSTIGTRGTGGINNANVYVGLQDIETRVFSLSRLVRETLAGQPSAAWEGNFSQREKMQEVRQRLAKFDDLRVSVRNLTSLRQGAPVDIDFVIEGPEISALAGFSQRLAQKARQIPGIVDVDTTYRQDKPEIQVEIDRERAAALGIEVREIAETLRIAVGGDDRVSRYLDSALDDAYDVELRLIGIDRSNPVAIGQLYVRTGASRSDPSLGARTNGSRSANGSPAGLTRLDNVAQFHYAETSPRIDRVDRQRMVAIRANLAPGFALADRIEAIREAAAELGMPAGYNTRVLGRGRELERTLQEFVWTFVLSFVFMYIVLAAQFEHLIHPLTILVSLPMAVPFGLLSLWIGSETLNLYSALGILVLFGVVKKNSILQVDHTNQLRAQGMERNAAILQANRDRLRPILMTTIAFVAGMLPLLIGVGPGAEERRSIAVLAAGGQTLSLALTLLATPVIYSLFDDLTKSFKRGPATGPLTEGAIVSATVPLAHGEINSLVTSPSGNGQCNGDAADVHNGEHLPAAQLK